MIEPGQNHDGGYTIKIGNERIPESNVEKILGVEVDNKLTWDEHFKKSKQEGELWDINHETNTRIGSYEDNETVPRRSYQLPHQVLWVCIPGTLFQDEM